MKALSRDFTTREKILLLVLSLALLALGYFQFVYKPTQEALDTAVSTREAMQVELDGLTARLLRLNRMQNEIDQVISDGTVSPMPSYNNSKAELALLNDLLSGTEQYSVSFSNVTRDGDQIRRDFALEFTASDLNMVKAILFRLSGSGYRCLVDDLRCVFSGVTGSVQVSTTATFYETMVGGVPDAGLPESSAVAG